MLPKHFIFSSFLQTQLPPSRRTRCVLFVQNMFTSAATFCPMQRAQRVATFPHTSLMRGPSRPITKRNAYSQHSHQQQATANIELSIRSRPPGPVDARGRGKPSPGTTDCGARRPRAPYAITAVRGSLDTGARPTSPLRPGRADERYTHVRASAARRQVSPRRAVTAAR